MKGELCMPTESDGWAYPSDAVYGVGEHVYEFLTSELLRTHLHKEFVHSVRKGRRSVSVVPHLRK